MARRLSRSRRRVRAELLRVLRDELRHLHMLLQAKKLADAWMQDYVAASRGTANPKKGRGRPVGKKGAAAVPPMEYAKRKAIHDRINSYLSARSGASMDAQRAECTELIADAIIASRERINFGKGPESTTFVVNFVKASPTLLGELERIMDTLEARPAS